MKLHLLQTPDKNVLGKRICLTMGLYFLFVIAVAAQKTTVEFARYNDGTVLSMDIYQPANKAKESCPIILFAFGGGFFTGSRSDTVYQSYIHFCNQKGFAFAAIDYRLGLKGLKKAPSLFNRKPLINAIAMAVEDTYAATKYLIAHAQALAIDTGKIILCGSSAGAITVLQSDYEKRNSFLSSSVLPASFQYAGVIACAGAIYSTKGKPGYAIPPAPTLLFHGNKDKIVPYNKISFLGTGLFGSSCIAKKRKKDGHPYTFYSFEDIDHSAAIFPLREFQQEIYQFIKDDILLKKSLFVDVYIKDNNRKNTITGTLADAMRKQN